MLDWLVRLSRRPFHDELSRKIRVVSPFFYCRVSVSACEYSRRMRCSSMHFRVKLDKHELLGKAFMLFQVIP